jgi:ribonucleoside-diphosphate reductase subunit M2
MIICDATNIEQESVRNAIPVRLIGGMNRGLMCQYIDVCVDRLMVALQQPHMDGVTNLFPWTTSISLQGKTNFFVKYVGEYAKSGVGVDAAHHEFSIDF